MYVCMYALAKLDLHISVDIKNLLGLSMCVDPSGLEMFECRVMSCVFWSRARFRLVCGEWGAIYSKRAPIRCRHTPHCYCFEYTISPGRHTISLLYISFETKQTRTDVFVRSTGMDCNAYRYLNIFRTENLFLLWKFNPPSSFLAFFFSRNDNEK